jgi:hypothetical protein
MKKKFLFISCEEAKHICDKSQYGESTVSERLKLSLRLLWCRITKAYSKNNKKLTDTLGNAEISCLKSYEREKIENEFNQELSKHKD